MFDVLENAVSVNSDGQMIPTGMIGSGVSVANNLITTEEGHILDARQGKVLKDALDETKQDLTQLKELERSVGKLTGQYISDGTIYYSVLGKTLFFHALFTPNQNISSSVGSITCTDIPALFSFITPYIVIENDQTIAHPHTAGRVAYSVIGARSFRPIGAYESGKEYSFGGVAFMQ